ncbi:MAG: Rrf2 family transcriptional regulator [Chloroflexota bacterium]|nr:Rrf2 family transcriptional regulator [Chloroflexota bacterium]
MKVSTKARYAIRAMLELAIYEREGPMLIRDISQRTGVSEQYLEQLFTRLRTAGLVRSIRGARGGFCLVKSPDQVKISDIVQAMEGSIAPVECVDDTDVCSRVSSCATREVWVAMKEAIDKTLNSLTLQDLARRQELKRRESVEMYNI